MKIAFKNGSLTATAESMEDVAALMSMGGVKPIKQTKVRYRKPCAVCGKICKGPKGISTHMRLMHQDQLQK